MKVHIFVLPNFDSVPPYFYSTLYQPKGTYSLFIVQPFLFRWGLGEGGLRRSTIIPPNLGFIFGGCVIQSSQISCVHLSFVCKNKPPLNNSLLYCTCQTLKVQVFAQSASIEYRHSLFLRLNHGGGRLKAGPAQQKSPINSSVPYIGEL